MPSIDSRIRIRATLLCLSLVGGLWLFGCALGDEGPPFDAGPPLMPCGSPDIDDDGLVLPIERENITWVDAQPLIRGRNTFTFDIDDATIASVVAVDAVAELVDRDHDAFVPAAVSLVPTAEGELTLPIDLYLEGRWAVHLRLNDDSGPIGEEARFAFCVSP